jgi:type VI secretion system secreted protein VgrG
MTTTSIGQTNRLLRVATPFGDDELLLVALHGHEAISECFCFDLEMISENAKIRAADLIAKPITVSMVNGQGARHLNGFVNEFVLMSNTERVSRYKLNLVREYRKREYCVQYRETAFNFVMRLMEEDGICFYFQHGAHNHTPVLADGLGRTNPAPSRIMYVGSPRAGRDFTARRTLSLIGPGGAKSNLSDGRSPIMISQSYWRMT